MNLSCNPELISHKTSDNMSLNLWNCSNDLVCLGGKILLEKKVLSEIRTLEDD